MTCFHVVYHQGSFTFAERCRTHEEAVSYASSVREKPGVWLVRIQDEHGWPLPHGFQCEIAL